MKTILNEFFVFLPEQKLKKKHILILNEKRLWKGGRGIVQKRKGDGSRAGCSTVRFKKRKEKKRKENNTKE